MTLPSEPLRWVSLVVLALSVPAFAQEQAPYGAIDGLKVARPEDRQDVAVVPPPSGALVLFDGTDLDEWVRTDGKSSPAWKLVDGNAMQVVPKAGGIMTRRKFDGHFRLHVE